MALSVCLRLLAVCFFIPCTISLAHNGVKHKASAVVVENVIPDSVNATKDTSIAQFPFNGHEGEDLRDISAFSSLHPLIVHFPIVLLIILPFFHLVSFFRLKKEIGIAVIIISALGCITAYLASNNFHPHTFKMPQELNVVLEEHDLYAYWTVLLSFSALIAKVVSIFLLKSNRYSEIIVMLLLVSSAFSVTMAGHHGARLSQIYGVGAQGKYIMKH